jgi:hypothetical protein
MVPLIGSSPGQGVFIGMMKSRGCGIGFRSFAGYEALCT